MQFEFAYTKTGSLFHFVSNLSEWHIACRKRDNVNWLTKTGLLSQEEKIALKGIRPILKKYNYGKKFLGIPFIRSSDDHAWVAVKEWVGVESYQVLRQVFKVFTPRFEEIWSREEPKLKKWQERLGDLTKEQETQGLVSDLEAFFNVSANSAAVAVFLLINSTQRGSGGNANVGKGAVVLDCSSTKLESANWVLATLWHETIHLVFEKQQFEPLLREFLKKHGHFILKSHVAQLLGRPTPVIQEAVLEALVPAGLLAKRYFDLDAEKLHQEQLGKNYERVRRNPKNYRLWYTFAAQKLMPLIEEYLRNKRSIDTKFLEATFSTYKRYLALVE